MWKGAHDLHCYRIRPRLRLQFSPLTSLELFSPFIHTFSSVELLLREEIH